MHAREFLDGMNQLPPVPWTIPVIAIGVAVAGIIMAILSYGLLGLFI